MQIQKIAPFFAIAIGVLLRWLGGSPMEGLAWIFVAGGLAGALLDLLLASRRAPAASGALPKAVLASEPESWSQSVSVIAADALADAGLIAQSARPHAAEVIGEEIAVRLSVGDYPAQAAHAVPAGRSGA